jgi:hypothetical protein
MPLVPGVVRWGLSPSPGVDPATASIFGPSAQGMADVGPHGRASIDPEASAGADFLARWKDGAPLLEGAIVGSLAFGLECGFLVGTFGPLSKAQAKPSDPTTSKRSCDGSSEGHAAFQSWRKEIVPEVPSAAMDESVTSVDFPSSLTVTEAPTGGRFHS